MYNFIYNIYIYSSGSNSSSSNMYIFICMRAFLGWASEPEQTRKKRKNQEEMPVQRFDLLAWTSCRGPFFFSSSSFLSS